jgi:thiamine-monophosphate kinase
MFRLLPLIPALNGGEDYELLFTVPLSEKEKIERVQDVSIIGYMHEDSNKKLLIPVNGEEIELKALGW